MSEKIVEGKQYSSSNGSAGRPGMEDELKLGQASKATSKMKPRLPEAGGEEGRDESVVWKESRGM